MQYPYSKFYISSELPKITTVNETVSLTGDTRKIFVSNNKTVDESHSARVLIGCKPITVSVFSSEILTCKASGDPPPEMSWILSNNTRVRNVVRCKHEYKLWMKKCAFPLTNGFFGFKARAYKIHGPVSHNSIRSNPNTSAPFIYI